MPLMGKCCCFVPLKAGTLAIGVVEVITTFIAFILTALRAGQVGEFRDAVKVEMEKGPIASAIYSWFSNYQTCMTILSVYWVVYLLVTLGLLWGAYAESPYLLAPWLLNEAMRIVLSQILGMTAILKADSWAFMLANSTLDLPSNTTLYGASRNLYMHINVPGIMALIGVLISFYLILVVYSFFEELRQKAHAVVPMKKEVAPAKVEKPADGK